MVVCYPRLVDIQFSEGVWVDKCDFTINLEADTLLDEDKVDNEGTFIIPNNGGTQENTTETVLLGSLSGAFINDYSEDWSIEVDESTGESPDLPFSYRITHSLNATELHFQI